MWKNNQPSTSSVSDDPPARPPSSSDKRNTTAVASLGPSIVIKGSLAGDEDLIIEGQVEGEVSLRSHSVTIGSSGRVKADVFGSSICVEGEVTGHLYGEEQVIIRQSGKVRGNVTAPRVNLEDGAKFKGSIDMQPGSAKPAPAGAVKERPRANTSSGAPVGAPEAVVAASAKKRAAATRIASRSGE